MYARGPGQTGGEGDRLHVVDGGAAQCRQIDDRRDVGAGEIDALEAGAVERDIGEGDIGEDDVAESGAGEVDTGDPTAPDGHPFEGGRSHRGEIEDAVVEADVAQVRLAEIDAAQPAAHEADPPKTVDPSSGEVHVLEHGVGGVEGGVGGVVDLAADEPGSEHGDRPRRGIGERRRSQVHAVEIREVRIDVGVERRLQAIREMRWLGRRRLGIDGCTGHGGTVEHDVVRKSLRGHDGAVPDSRRSSPWMRVAAATAAAVGAVLAAIVPASAADAPWNISRVGGPSTAPGVVIAIVDTGVDATHPAFGDRVLPQLDFTGDPQAGDPEGHGTHVAGTAAGGSIDCGDGPVTIGVAPEASILPIRVLDADGSGTVTNVVKGIRAAADHGAAVINLSLGGDLSFLDGGGSAFRDAITYAWTHGSIPVLAAGNSGLLGGVFGSGYGDLDAVVVTATTNRDVKAGYASSVGSARWGIAAPGGDGSGAKDADVLSAYPDRQCALMAGTSMAAPHVSGALAALRARGLSPQDAVDRMLGTARGIGSAGVYGAGLLDVRAATAGAAAPPSSSSTTRRAATTSTTLARAPDTTVAGRSSAADRSPDRVAPVPTSAAVTTTSGDASHAPAAADSVPDPIGRDDDPDLAAAPVPIGAQQDDGPSGALVGLATACCAGVWLAVITLQKRRAGAAQP